MAWNDTDNNRGQWAFEYPIGMIVEGAKRKYAYHVRKMQEYADRLARINEEIRKAPSMTIVENEDEFNQGYADLSSNVSRGSDQDREMMACKAKIDQHRNDARAYTKYIVALSAQDPNRDVLCTVDDIMYFGLEDDTAPGGDE